MYSKVSFGVSEAAHGAKEELADTEARQFVIGAHAIFN